MADVFTPAPPAAPAECVAPATAPKPPSSSWLADYLGTPSQPVDNDSSISVNGADGIWWPRSQAYEYMGRQLYFDNAEHGPSFDLTTGVPDGELWRFNWIAIDWITNTASTTRFFQLAAYDNITGFGYNVYGTQSPGDNSGGTVAWMPGVNSASPRPQYIQETLPSPLWLYSNWTLTVQIVNAGSDFLNTLRADIERWRVVPRPTSGSGGSGGGAGPTFGPTGGGATGGPYFAPAP